MKDKNQIKCEVVFTEEELVRFKQDWFGGEADGVSCEVLMELGGGHIEIVINEKHYVLDMKKLVQTLVNKVLAPAPEHKELTQETIDANTAYMGGVDDVAGD